MTKRKFVNPFIFFDNEGPGDDVVIGMGTAEGTPDILPYDFEMWSVLFGEDDDSDGDNNPGTWSDYIAWMKKYGFEEFIDYGEEPINP